MRLIPVCLPLVLAPLIVAGQQAQAPTAQTPQQTSTAKQTSTHRAHKATAHRRSRHHSRKAHARKAAKRAGLCADSQIAVNVINGTQGKQVCMDKSALAENKAKPAAGQMKVEVINGSSTDTQYFSGKTDEAVRNQPVVVGVQTGDTRSAGGNKNPVVTGVTSSSTVDAKTASAGGQPVAKQISPRPKRPTYEPDAH